MISAAMEEGKVTCAGTFADGSFGVYAKKRGDLVRVWLCGSVRKRNGVAQDSCAHGSRREATQCAVHARRQVRS